MAGHITRIMYMEQKTGANAGEARIGRVRFARVRIGDAKFAARVPSGFSVPDNSVGLVFDPAHVHVYADSHLVEGVA